MVNLTSHASGAHSMQYVLHNSLSCLTGKSGTAAISSSNRASSWVKDSTVGLSAPTSSTGVLKTSSRVGVTIVAVATEADAVESKSLARATVMGAGCNTTADAVGARGVLAGEGERCCFFTGTEVACWWAGSPAAIAEGAIGVLAGVGECSSFFTGTGLACW